MTQQPASLHPAVAKSLASWHQMIEKNDLSELRTIVHPDATFRSPMAINSYKSADAVILALTTVITVFENFAYHRQFVTDDGLNVVLEFSANVGEKLLKGADFVRFDEDGKIIEFEVMIRPLSGLQALGQEMGKRLGHVLPEYKVKP
ncbi:nuclear transport factor 2 family protein [Noviherbaspirillum saxi]|uniref:Nuclear transport factor 2 family protein n=1 Tax=Noviherbaspirillum saxi TaxID=2320863 RepID=A0A3A3G3J5_9BURK|nr:nuclear transport factor 2 family protein [Noviherbaspirillum saxi]RJF95986.1 nuclear transport factor 2 family protein [Noviherbaspirillum saxi]